MGRLWETAAHSELLALIFNDEDDANGKNVSDPGVPGS